MFRTISGLGFLTLLGAVVLLASPAVGNQLVNGDFEAGSVYDTPPPNWTGYGAFVPFVNNSGTPWGTTPHGGLQYAGEAANWGTKSGGIYQTAFVVFGSTGTAQVWVRILNMENPTFPNVSRIGIDPTGGTDEGSGDIEWTTYDTTTGDTWVLVETPEVTATASVVTVFLEYVLSLADMGNAVFFDDCVLTGTLTDATVPGTPPDTTDLTLTSPLPFTEGFFGYVLTDGEDADPDASIAPQYRLGHMLDDTSLPGMMSFVKPAQASMPSATDGDGTGTGTWRIQGVDGGLWRGETSRTGTALVYEGLAPAGAEITVDIKISDWERTTDEFNPIGADWEGAGLCLMSRDLSYYYMVGSFDSEGTDSAVMTESNWHISSGNTGVYTAWYNLEGTGVPTDGADPIYYRLVRGATSISAGYSRTSTGFSMFHITDVSGTPLDLMEDLLFGIVVNDEVVVNVEYIMSSFMSATSTGNGDGTTGLASTSAGNAHVFAWDAGLDLAAFGGFVNGQLKITARDDHGWGAPDFSDFFLLSRAIQSWAPAWETYR